uniref:ESCRT-II complex subunit VPS25 n=1 Tax=Albugo laibachii Nc14 TaxID=890382 RepID=F0WAB1_9STRA|nr:conserved hypothetical protein [Albugo laibachii Nc14]|eukprot:CCA18081.1 conserved hypothetical protein [Albugo laibachii Nc14]
MGPTKEFTFPEYFDFPPFFTIQPVRATREKQLGLWKQLILDYHHAKEVSIFNPQTSPVFENSKISRKMKSEGRTTIIEFLIQCGNAMWEDISQTRCRVMWKKPTEWAVELYDFVKDRGMLGEIYTVYELYAGEETLGSQFHGMEPWILRDALKILEQHGKAMLIFGATCQEDGVKFIAVD